MVVMVEVSCGSDDAGGGRRRRPAEVVGALQGHFMKSFTRVFRVTGL